MKSTRFFYITIMADRCTTLSPSNVITKQDKPCGNISGVDEVWIASYRPLTLQVNDNNIVFNLLYADTNEAPTFSQMFVEEDSTTVQENLSADSLELYDTVISMSHNLKTTKNDLVFKTIAKTRTIVVVKDFNSRYWLLGSESGLIAQSLENRINPIQFEYVIQLIEQQSSIGIIEIDGAYFVEFVPTEGGIRLRDETTFATMPDNILQRLNTSASGFSIYIKYVNYIRQGQVSADTFQVFGKGTTNPNDYVFNIRPYTTEPDFHSMELFLSGQRYYAPKLPNGTLIEILISYDGQREIFVESNAFAVSPKFIDDLILGSTQNQNPLIFGGGFNGILYDFKLYNTFFTLADIEAQTPVYEVGFNEDVGLVFQDSTFQFGVIDGYTIEQSGIPDRFANEVWYDLLQQPKTI